MRRIFVGIALSLGLAAPAAAQEAQPNRWLLEPYAGAFNDSYDISPDGDATGVRLGLRLGYALGGRTRLIAEAAYATSRDVGDPNGLESYFVYDNVWALTTVGAELDVIPGPTSVALGVQVGAGWRRNELAGRVGDPPAYAEWYGGGGFSPVDAVVPSLTVRHRVSRRASLMLGLQDQIFDALEGPSKHSPALSVGVSLR